MKQMIYVTASLGLVALLGACGNSSHEKSKGTENLTGISTTALAPADVDICKSGLESFTKNVHPVLRNNCASCHGDGSTMAPQHSVADPVESYKRIKALTNFNDVEGSRFYTKGGNEHCVTGGVNCGVDFAKIKNLVTAWWVGGERDCVQPVAYISEAKALPSDLPFSRTDFVNMRWDLSKLNADFAGVYFEVDAQQIAKPSSSASGAYRFRRPRLATATKALHVKGIKIFVNGMYDELANEWTDVEVDVNPKAFSAQDKIWPHPTLATQHLIVLQPGDGSTIDKISIAFDALRVTTMVQCMAPAVFKDTFFFAMDRRNCFTCHGAGSDQPDAVKRFDLSGSMESICTSVKERTNSSSPTDSVVLAYSVNGFAKHQRIFINADEAVQYLAPWIAKEVPSQSFTQMLSLMK